MLKIGFFAFDIHDMQNTRENETKRIKMSTVEAPMNRISLKRQELNQNQDGRHKFLYDIRPNKCGCLWADG